MSRQYGIFAVWKVLIGPLLVFGSVIHDISRSIGFNVVLFSSPSESRFRGYNIISNR